MKPLIIALITFAAAAAILAICAGIFSLVLLKNGVCPLCWFKKFSGKKRLTIELPAENYPCACEAPPMGWSSWNTFHNKIDEKLIYDTAQAMKSSSLVKAGYTYINIDDCWHSSSRDVQGRLQPDMTAFPHGISRLREQIESEGMSLGVYSSNGTHTCEDLPASLGNERKDAETFIGWGAKYLKYDFCNNKRITGLAPKIEGISLNLLSDTDTESEIDINDGTFTGRARVVNYNRKISTDMAGFTGIIPKTANSKIKRPAKYIGFLSYAGGKASYKATVEQSGKYILTLTLKKDNKREKYLRADINSDTYELFIPGLNPWTAQARHQIVVELKKGENTLTFYNPVVTAADSAYLQYKRMSDELLRAAREKGEQPPVFSICEWGVNSPWIWGAKAGTLWRTTRDILPYWPVIMARYEKNIKLYKYSSKGHFNDPDMLEVGNGHLSAAENTTHFALWCMMSAPLILGNDIRKFADTSKLNDKDSEILKLITNKKLISIDADSLCKSAKRLKNGSVQILARPLSGGRYALMFFNKGRIKRNINFSIKELCRDKYINTPEKSAYEIEDILNENTFSADTIRAELGKHQCAVYIIK